MTNLLKVVWRGAWRLGGALAVYVAAIYLIIELVSVFGARGFFIVLGVVIFLVVSFVIGKIVGEDR